MNVLFEYTQMGKNAAQGGSPSGLEGYDIWLVDGHDQYWLGFCTLDKKDDWVYYYQQQGDKVYLKS